MARHRFSNLPFVRLLASVSFLLLAATQVGAQEFGSQQPPPPPTNITALSQIKGGVSLQWNEVVTPPNVVKYSIFRYDNSDANKTVTPLAIVPRNKVPSHALYWDKTAEVGHSYSYFLTSTDAFGIQSQNSKIATIRR